MAWLQHAKSTRAGAEACMQRLTRHVHGALKYASYAYRITYHVCEATRVHPTPEPPAPRAVRREHEGLEAPPEAEP